MTAEERRQQIIADINAVAAQLDHEHEQERERAGLPAKPLTGWKRFLPWGFAVLIMIGMLGGPFFVFKGLALVGVIDPSSWGKRPQVISPYEYIETLDVDGECAEDHAKMTATYEGHLTHYRYISTGDSVVAGHVTLTPDMRHGFLTHHDPYRYEPSFRIRFGKLRPEDLQGDVLQLAGVSEYLADEESRRPSYRATCTLRVTRRLDHQPSQQEETAE